MTTPLVNHINFDVMTKYGNNILLGTATEIPEFNIRTERYLNQLDKMKHYLLDHAQPISLEKYINNFR